MGAHDYIHFCINCALPLNPTPSTLAHYIAYASQILQEPNTFWLTSTLISMPIILIHLFSL